MIGIIVAIVLAVSALGGGTVYASQDSLPGDVLYPVKLGTEHVRVAFAGGDIDKAELYLTFANSRVEEMTALAEKGRPENVNVAVNGYDEAIAKAIEKMEAASGKGVDIADISELVGEATLRHLEDLEGLLDTETDPTVPEEAEGGITQAIEISMNGYENALRALARENPVSAMEINLGAMEGRLDRAKAKGEANDIEGVENALLEFEALHRFGEEISEIAQGLSEEEGTTVNELVTEATFIHLAVLGEVLAIVPEEAQEAIESAMAGSVEGYGRAVEALEEAGALGDIPEEPPIPAGIPDEVEDRLLKPEEVPERGRP